MTRSKTHSSELENLRQELRTARSEIKNLKKQLSQANKHLHRLDDLEDMVKETIEPVVVSAAKKCPECSGRLTSVEIGTLRIIYSCTECKYRKTEKRK